MNDVGFFSFGRTPSAIRGVETRSFRVSTLESPRQVIVRVTSPSGKAEGTYVDVTVYTRMGSIAALPCP